MVLIPTNSDKSYCIAKFIKNLQSIDLDNCDILFANDEINEEYADSIRQLGYEVIKVEKTIEDIKRGKRLTIPECLANTRNCLREEFLKRKHDYAVWFDSDIIMPKNTIPLLLENNGKDIVSGFYWQSSTRMIDGKPQTERIPVVYKYQDQEGYELGLGNYGATITLEEVFPSRFIGDNDSIKITAIGFGCVLISRKVMEDQRWSFRAVANKKTTEDMWFSIDIKNLDYKIYADSRVCCRHLSKAWRPFRDMNNEKKEA